MSSLTIPCHRASQPVTATSMNYGGSDARLCPDDKSLIRRLFLFSGSLCVCRRLPAHTDGALVWMDAKAFPRP
jgi:hypothetical protein